MIETILVLVVLVFLFGFVIIFYARFQFFEIDRIAKQIDEERADSYLNKIISMPELRCSMSFGTASEINCIDTYKLLALTKLRTTFAEEFAGLSSVKIERIDISSGITGATGNECTAVQHSYPKNCDTWILLPGSDYRMEIETFVTLCTQKGSALYNCEIGRLIVGTPKR